MSLSVAGLAFIAFRLNSVLDGGDLDDLSIESVRQGIEQGTIFKLLQERIADLDLTHLTTDMKTELMQ